MELIELVIKVYKKMEELDRKARIREIILWVDKTDKGEKVEKNEKGEKIEDPEPDIEEYEDLDLMWLYDQRKALKLQPNKKDLKEPDPELLKPDQIVPDDPQKMIKMTMATFPISICETAFEEKFYSMYSEAIKSESVFFQNLCLKILQSLCVDARYRGVRLISDDKVKILETL